jgi:hypothetical protein
MMSFRGIVHRFQTLIPNNKLNSPCLTHNQLLLPPFLAVVQKFADPQIFSDKFRKQARDSVAIEQFHSLVIFFGTDEINNAIRIPIKRRVTTRLIRTWG